MSIPAAPRRSSSRYWITSTFAPRASLCLPTSRTSRFALNALRAWGESDCVLLLGALGGDVARRRLFPRERCKTRGSESSATGLRGREGLQGCSQALPRPHSKHNTTVRPRARQEGVAWVGVMCPGSEQPSLMWSLPVAFHGVREARQDACFLRKGRSNHPLI